MTTYNTGNPIGSTDPRDLYDNAQNYDFALNSLTEAIWLDRFGVGRRTWYGLEVMVADAAASFGIITLSSVSFTTGATVNLNEALLNTANNTYYKWTGTFPDGGKIVPPSSTPESTGGIGPGKWLSVGDTVLRNDLAADDGFKIIGQKVNYGIPSGATLTRGLIWAYDKVKGWLRVGGSDIEPLDDERNYWRGLPSRNSWGDPAMIGDYSVSFNRNGASFAVYTTTFGHDCVTYGVASLAGGAGSATGNPDDITSPNAEGYCSFAFGKNVIALGAKSAALCEDTQANSRASFAAGYYSQARAGFTTDPGGVASDGVGAIALGYQTRAAGDGSFAAGRNVQAYGGAIALGNGINDGNPAVNPSRDSVSLFSKSVVPGVTVAPGAGGLTDFSKVGIHSQYPKELLDVVLPTGQSAALRISSSGAGNSGKLLLQGTANDGSALTIATIEWTSVNGGVASPTGTLKINMNNGAPSIELSTDGMIALKNVKTLGEISGAPAGTVYKDGSNFLKIV
ncbi:TPA: hypothetical protein ACOEGY_003491 [Enterobacter bugandensis]|uniref:tail fiber/spike domain-containing protein n=1 Tax=Enterobacter bugandensis TaxID=881260 RepID=UPI0020033471|nr:hypothetical protein [Enterobacter bugandensis]MCK7087829.1 hypothetical protein [Enterobacter bugandensis]MCK7158691.1 hypothetical protein [Enterobacter bugandensis]